VSLRPAALGAIDEAFWVALAVAAYCFTFTLILYLRDSENGLSLGLLLSAVCFALFAIGLHLRSRVAAILACSFSSLELLYNLFTGHSAGRVISVLVGLALPAGIRGSVAYHKLPARPEKLPSLLRQLPLRQELNG
jgi:hypothetical protein